MIAIFENFPPLVWGAILFVAATALGIWPIKKLIIVREAKHELKHGSAGFIRTLSGWSIIAFWVMVTWFLATILGDWHIHGDLAGAIERSGNRLRILLEIAAALADD